MVLPIQSNPIPIQSHPRQSTRPGFCLGSTKPLHSFSAYRTDYRHRRVLRRVGPSIRSLIYDDAIHWHLFLCSSSLSSPPTHQDSPKLTSSLSLSSIHKSVIVTPAILSDWYSQTSDSLMSMFNRLIKMVAQIKLNTGHSLPQIGFGTWQSAPGEVDNAVYEALKAGYRYIVTFFLPSIKPS